MAKAKTKHWDVIILGGGAAGLMCAWVAGRRQRRVLLLEHMPEVGKKILISGGGRCNFTNLYASPDQYISQNPHFAKSALARFTPYDFLALVEAQGIAWYEKKLGQLFCKGSAQEIVSMLLAHCAAARVKIQTGATIQRVLKNESGFEVHSSAELLSCESLVLACGGLSIPKVGASNLGYRLLRQFEHPLVNTRPALVPLTLHPQDQELTSLRGLSVDSVVRCGEASFRENTLFTHFGLSGPAILQISSYWQSGQPLEIDFLPGLDLQTELQQALEMHSEQHLGNWLKSYLPARWLQYWSEHYNLPRLPLKQLKGRELETVIKILKFWQLKPSGTAGYGKAEVTLGGADTRYFSSRTMESQKVSGLYCIGELMDVTGWLGGYNFQWAWASAQAAGSVV